MKELKDKVGKKLPYREGNDYVAHLITRSADVAINGAVASSKSSVVLRWSRIAVSAAAVLILGLLCFSKLNSESEYEAYKNSMSLSEVLNSMSDEDLMYVSYYEIEDIPEYE